MPGELPPPPPRNFFGRDELIEKIVGLVEDTRPIALIGAGGIGKTSIALTVLHDNRIKQQFGDHRWFIRCDKFTPSCIHFLHQLSTVIGAGVENPKDLAPLRPFLSSKKMFIVLDNAESILGLQGSVAGEINSVVEELSQYNNICLCITSRISVLPPGCELLDIPTLSMEAAHNTFYCIYKHGDPSNLAHKILGQLDFHPLSITLLATVAQNNRWNTKRLTREWEKQRTGMLHTQQNKSLAATIELSLASPMFQDLGPNARPLLEVVAFFPQGIDENNLDWLFPSIPNRTDILDKFCILSLAYQNNGFITMLAPLRDYLCPKSPLSTPLLNTTKEHYFSRLSVKVDPDSPGFGEAQWIISEDVNVEHLLDVFTTIDKSSVNVWDACAYFMRHLHWHKMRLVSLGPKIEGLPDNHPSKQECLFQLGRLLNTVGNPTECRRLLIYTLELQRKQGDGNQVAETLKLLSDTNRTLGLFTEGIPQAREALKIYEQLNNTVGQGQALINLAWLLWQDNQIDAAEKVAFNAISLCSDQGSQFVVCECHRVLGNVCHSRGESEKAINHIEIALGIASSFNWHSQIFFNHYYLANLLFGQGRFSDAHGHIKHAKSHTTNNTYYLGYATELQAEFWYKQQRLKEAKSEALHAVELYGKIGAISDIEDCRKLLQKIEKAISDGKSPGITLFCIPIHHLSSV